MSMSLIGLRGFLVSAIRMKWSLKLENKKKKNNKDVGKSNLKWHNEFDACENLEAVET